MFDYFYNEILRSVIIGFGSLFNDIEVQHKNDKDQTSSVIQVPIAYGPTQKFLARMQQEANLNRPIQITLPRMSFEFTSLSYDPERKTTKNQNFITQTPDGSQIKRVYSPVPYNMGFTLSIYTKLNDDMLQIVEQILPYFQPQYNLSIKFLGNLNEVRDIPVVLDNIEMSDDYEGNFDTRRALIYTLSFTVKTYLYGPITDITGDIIKKVTVGYVAGETGRGGLVTRDLSYTVTPRATKDYDNSLISNLAEDVDFTQTAIKVTNPGGVTEKTYIYVGTEEMFVEKIVGDELRVRRAQDNTKPSTHVLGTDVYSITAEDDKLIEFGDDFGFNGNIF
jgi:hypothetical protein